MDLDALLKYKPDEVVGVKRPAEDADDMPARPGTKRAALDGRGAPAPGPSLPDLSDKERMERLMDDAAEVENFDGSVMKRCVNNLQRAINRNQELRTKHPDDPKLFMDSEIDLDEAINALMPLPSAPELYKGFANMKGIEMLASLLAHENSDISITVISLLYDITDVDESYEDSDVLDVIIEHMQQEELLPMLVSNLTRLDETAKEEADGVHKLLGVIENLLEFRPALTGVIASTTKLVAWLLERVLVREMDSNRLYASEILSIFVQDIQGGGQRVMLEQNGMDTILRAVSRYKKRNERTAEEKEMVGNLFTCICSMLMNGGNLDIFLQVEGIGLMVLIIKGKMNSRCAALKVLDFALNNEKSGKLCEHVVETLGLKTLFPCFMKTPGAKYLKGCGMTAKEYEEHACSCIGGLFVHMDGTNHLRLLNKFEENDFAKMDRLFELHNKYSEELARCDEHIQQETRQLMIEGEEMTEEQENEFYMKRLSSGLYMLHVIDSIIAHVVASDLAGAGERFEMLLHQSGQDYGAIIRILKDKLKNGGADPKGMIQKLIDMKSQPASSNSTVAAS